MLFFVVNGQDLVQGFNHCAADRRVSLIHLLYTLHDLAALKTILYKWTMAWPKYFCHLYRILALIKRFVLRIDPRKNKVWWNGGVDSVLPHPTK